MSIKGFSVGGSVERYDYNFLDNRPNEITVDTALSDSSTNPVQNRVVTSAINSANGSISSISGEVDGLKSALSEYDDEFKRSEWIATKMQTSSSLNVEVYPDRSVQTSGASVLALAAVTGHYSYCFIAPKELIVAANADASYYCIGTLQNPIKSAWSTDSYGTIYKMGTDPTRYRASDNNLPSHESPLRIAAGTQVVVTVNDAIIPFLDLYDKVFVDLITEEELFESKKTFVGCNLLNTTALTVDAKTGRSGSTTSSLGGHPALQLDAYAGYDSYCFFAPRDISIAAVADSNAYYAITKLTDPNYSDWQTSGSLLWNNGTSVARVRKSENNLPTTANPMTLHVGTLIAVTVAAGETASILIQDDKTETIKSELLGVASPYIDVEMHNGYFYYYIPTVSGNYLRYKFMHFVDAASNADGWVQRTVDLSPNNKVGTLMQVVCDGEWEIAIKLKDRTDFIGTMNHGSEVATIANLYFDGVKTTVTDGTRLSCKEIRVNQKSTMYDPNDETTVVGYHYRTHFITADGVRIKQRIEWVTDQILDKSYCGMLPAVRGNDATSSVQVTDHAYDGKTYEEYDCATTNLNPYLTSYTDKGNVFYLRGESSGISMSIECDIENRPSSSFTFLSNSAYYNKVYFAYNDSNYQVSSGDVWKWVSIYKIEYAGN